MIRLRLSALALAALLLAGAAPAERAAEADLSRASREAPAASTETASLKTALTQAEAAYQARDFQRAIVWSRRYLSEGGNDPRIRAVLGRSLYLAGDFENAARNLHVEVSLAEKASRRPPEDALKYLAGCYSQLNDVAGQIWALEKLVTYYPRKEYWAELIARSEKRGNLSEGLMLDLWRLKLVTGTVETAADYMQAATLALAAGYPAEAEAMLDKGYAGGALGSGANAESQRRLKDLVAHQVAEGRKTLGAASPPVGASAPESGSPQVNAGFALVTYGEVARGIAMMEQGVQQPSSNRPQVDRLHLGIAYLSAGRKTDAIAMLKTITGAHGAAYLGRLWYLHALRESMS
jgi:tetratricopeptide (TPR) repeat protein